MVNGILLRNLPSSVNENIYQIKVEKELEKSESESESEPEPEPQSEPEPKPEENFNQLEEEMMKIAEESSFITDENGEKTAITEIVEEPGLKTIHTKEVTVHHRDCSQVSNSEDTATASEAEDTITPGQSSNWRRSSHGGWWSRLIQSFPSY